MWTPKQHHFSEDGNRHVQPVCHHIPKTTESVENSFSDCRILKTEGFINQYTLMVLFSLEAECVLGAQIIACIVDTDSSSQSGSCQPADDALGNVIFSGIEELYIL